jgi:hypothetical protein
LGGRRGWFYEDIRCGILHQSETRGGWRVWRRGPLVDLQGKTINAKSLIHHLQAATKSYAVQLQDDEELWRNFLRKMEKICENCE